MLWDLKESIEWVDKMDNSKNNWHGIPSLCQEKKGSDRYHRNMIEQRRAWYCGVGLH